MNKDITSIPERMSFLQRSINAQRKKENIDITNEMMIAIDPLVVLTEERDDKTNFAHSELPKISIRNYVYRIVKMSECSPEALFIAVVYIERLAKRTGVSLISNWTIHRIIITAVLLATKFYDDNYRSNRFYSRVGGISVKELNKCEIEFLARLSFDLLVQPNEIA